jgi:hypothetical protein
LNTIFGDGDDKCQRLNLFGQDRGDMRKADGFRVRTPKKRRLASEREIGSEFEWTSQQIRVVLRKKDSCAKKTELVATVAPSQYSD